MATAGAILQAARLKLDDTDSQRYLWTDAELVDYLNRVVDIFASELFLIEDASTAAVCTISLVGGLVPTHTYTLHESIVRIRRARISGETLNLEPRTIEYMDAYEGDWESADQATPTCYIDEGVGTGRIRVWPTPLVDGTLNLVVWRRPLPVGTGQTVITLNTLSSSPEIPVRFHDFLMDGILWFAYEKNDEEAEHVEKALKFRRSFEQGIEMLKRRELKRFYKPATIIAQGGNR